MFILAGFRAFWLSECREETTKMAWIRKVPKAAQDPPAAIAPAATAPAVTAPAATAPAVTAPAKDEETGPAPLNFRVSAEFRREFKTYAAAHDLKLNKLRTLSFHNYRKQQGD
jgi:hypothetical protein